MQAALFTCTQLGQLNVRKYLQRYLEYPLLPHMVLMLGYAKSLCAFEVLNYKIRKAKCLEVTRS